LNCHNRRDDEQQQREEKQPEFYRGRTRGGFFHDVSESIFNGAYSFLAFRNQNEPICDSCAEAAALSILPLSIPIDTGALRMGSGRGLADFPGREVVYDLATFRWSDTECPGSAPFHET
jgi:hypothetical protein